MTVARRAGLTGFGELVRFVLRRDRVRLTVWVVAIAALVLVSAASLPSLYPTQAAMRNYVLLASGNPALQAFGGPGYGFGDPNIGVILVNETQLWGAVCMALMAVFLVTRHTRAEEDDERAEVIRASVVGRHAPLAAASAVVAAAVVALSLICAVGFVALGYAAVGSIALAASLGAMGLVFVGVAAVAAQIANSGRATVGDGSAALAVMFLLRAVGDAGHNWLRWLSPLGWAQSGRAFAGERWWPLAMCVVLAIALVVLAHWLSTRRDLGAGLAASHSGPATASPALLRPTGLALRMQRGAIIGWSIGLFVTGVVYGSIGDQIATFIADNPAYADFLAQLEGVDLTDSFFATALLMLALLASGFAISAALRLRTEEMAGRADVVLAGPLGRARWAARYVAVDVFGTTVIILAGGLGAGCSYAVVTSDAGQIPRLMGAALATVPGVLVIVGATVALWGLVPRAALAAWAGLAVVFVVAFFGQVLRLPHWVRDISPLAHVPALPAVGLRWTPIVVLLAVAAALLAVGLRGLRVRDVHGS